MQNKKLEGSQSYPLFYKRMIAIAIPIMISQLILVSLNLADTIMVGKLGEDALAAVGAANQVFFVFIDIMFGVYSGAAVFAVQFYGIRDLNSFHKIVGIDFFLCFLFCIPMMAIALTFPNQLIGLFIEDKSVIPLGVSYLRIVAWTYILQGLTFAITFNSRAIERLTVPTIINCIAIFINIFLNYCLIYGKCGFERYEVKGAAYATLIARCFEFIAVYTYILLDKENPIRCKIKELKFEFSLFKDVMKKATPVIFNEAFWVISMTVGFAIYGRLGTSALAVVQVASTITDIFIACYCGLANAGNVIIGQNLGQGNREEAYFIARKVMKISWILNIVSTLIAILSREFICNVYGFSAETSELLMKSLLVYAILLTPRMMAYVLICGILRAGGDTTFSMLCDAGFNWIIQVPLILLAVKMGFPLPVCLAFAGVSEVCKTVASYIRIIKKKWMNVFTGR